MKLTPRPASSAAPEMLPILNVVLLLLVFFMLLVRLDPSAATATDLPQAHAEARLSGSAASLRLDARGRLYAGGEPLADRDLDAWLRQQAHQTVRLEGSRHASAQRVLAILGGLRAAGVEHVQILVGPPGA